ncbi:MAG: winged helix-turn-helix transcriptional regulator [Ramlibacter sp.]|nr:winged helix-turn-helix transcriptional regulator [Ramlibacter sp.]
MIRKARTPPHQSLLSTQDSPFYQLWVVTNLTAKPFAATFGKRFHLNLSDWRILLTVADTPGITAQALADYCGLDKMSVSRAVRNLEAQGRIAREGNTVDRRQRHLYLTDDGWAVYSEIATSAVERERDLYEALTPAELRKFKALLFKLSTRARDASGS